MDKAQIAAFYDVEPGAVVKYRTVDEGASVRVLIDYGIGGIKVYTEPVESFAPAEPVVGYESFTVRELQEIARNRGVSYSGLNKAELIDALYAADEEE